jgi:hypothetical protein
MIRKSFQNRELTPKKLNHEYKDKNKEILKKNLLKIMVSSLVIKE